MIRILYRHRSSGIVGELPVEKLQAAVQDKLLNLWIDIQTPSDGEARKVLEEVFRFHPLAIEDALQDTHVPKLDDFGTYLFLVVHTVTLGDERMDLHTHEIDIFLGGNYLVTMHEAPRATIDRLWQIDMHDSHGLARGPAFLLYEILDRQLDSYIPLVDQFEERVEALGDQIFQTRNGQKADMLNDILTAKSSALRLRRFLIPQRELINRLATLDYAVIPHETRIYFRDVYDHMVRLADVTEQMRDLAGATIDTHLAIVNNRTNDIMRLLTIISTIFIPLGFVAGIYGMNFDFMPELHWRYGYAFAWTIFLTIAGSLLYVFRRRGWL
jgi:magnesium transporter